MFKIIIIGETGVGKSSLTVRATKNKYIEDYTPTIGFEKSSLYIKINDTIIKLEIWDTCGQESYRSLNKSYYRNTSLAIIIYSINDESSFIKLNIWLNEIKSFWEENIIIFLVGNKIDIDEDKRKITTEMGNNIIKRIIISLKHLLKMDNI